MGRRDRPSQNLDRSALSVNQQELDRRAGSLFARTVRQRGDGEHFQNAVCSNLSTPSQLPSTWSTSDFQNNLLKARWTKWCGTSGISNACLQMTSRVQKRLDLGTRDSQGMWNKTPSLSYPLILANNSVQAFRQESSTIFHEHSQWIVSPRKPTPTLQIECRFKRRQWSERSWPKLLSEM